MKRTRASLWAAIVLVLGCVCAWGSPGGAAAQPGAVPARGVIARAAVPADAKVVPASNATIDVYTESGEVPELRVAGGEGAKLPLEHTHVSARITGFVAEVEVSQTYRNTQTQPIEAVYLFPLPENSAVHDMQMTIGARTIRAEIKRRSEARAVYEQAKRRGHTAALLEQERPNVFTQSLANIAPGESIDVVVRYLQDLSYDAGQYEFVFPMVVGPRYNPAGVADAQRITTSYLGQGDRSGHDISLELVIDGAAGVRDWQVPTHEVASWQPGDGTFHLVLSEKRSLPNRDFVLRYRVADAEPTATVLADGGYFSLIVQPPRLDVEELVGRRELIFVVDVSGSMFGAPLAMCQTAMREAIARLRPVDTFNILTFAGNTSAAFAAPVPANRSNVEQALAVVNGLRAGGGTAMNDAVKTALSSDVGSGRHRYVFFLTDGYVGNEAQIIATAETFTTALKQRGQRARVFGFGVGGSVNRFLLDGLSKSGDGLTVYATHREDPRRAVDRFYHYVDSPVLTRVSADWGAIGASDIMPAELPDLFASHALVAHGRYSGTLPRTVTLQAMVGDKPVTLEARVEASPHGAKTLGTLWARSKIGWLEQGLWAGQDPGAAEAITALGLEHRLVTQFTSFVAVDSSHTVGDGDPTRIDQPAHAPEGVDVGMAGGLAYGSEMHSGQLLSEPLAPPPEMEDAAGVHARMCGCRVVGAGTERNGWLALLGVALLLGRRRTRVAAARSTQ